MGVGEALVVGAGASTRVAGIVGGTVTLRLAMTTGLTAGFETVSTVLGGSIFTGAGVGVGEGRMGGRTLVGALAVTISGSAVVSGALAGTIAGLVVEAVGVVGVGVA